MPPPAGYVLDNPETSTVNSLPDLKKEAAKRKAAVQFAPEGGSLDDGNFPQTGYVSPPLERSVWPGEEGSTPMTLEKARSWKTALKPDQPDSRTPAPDVLDKAKDYFTRLSQPDPYRTDTKPTDSSLGANLTAAKNAAENAFVTMPGNLLRRAVGGLGETTTDVLRGARNVVQADLGDEYRQQQALGAVSDIAHHPVESTGIPGLLKDYTQDAGPEPELTAMSKVGGDVLQGLLLEKGAKGYAALKDHLATRIPRIRTPGEVMPPPQAGAEDAAVGQEPPTIEGVIPRSGVAETIRPPGLPEPGTGPESGAGGPTGPPQLGGQGPTGPRALPPPSTAIPVEDLGLGETGGGAPVETPDPEASRSYSTGGALQPQEGLQTQVQPETAQAKQVQVLEESILDRIVRHQETVDAVQADLKAIGLDSGDIAHIIDAIRQEGETALDRGDVKAALEAAHHQLLMEAIDRGVRGAVPDAATPVEHSLSLEDVGLTLEDLGLKAPGESAVVPQGTTAPVTTPEGAAAAPAEAAAELATSQSLFPEAAAAEAPATPPVGYVGGVAKKIGKGKRKKEDAGQIPIPFEAPQSAPAPVPPAPAPTPVNQFSGESAPEPPKAEVEHDKKGKVYEATAPEGYVHPDGNNTRVAEYGKDKEFKTRPLAQRAIAKWEAELVPVAQQAAPPTEAGESGAQPPEAQLKHRPRKRGQDVPEPTALPYQFTGAKDTGRRDTHYEGGGPAEVWRVHTNAGDMDVYNHPGQGEQGAMDEAAKLLGQNLALGVSPDKIFNPGTYKPTAMDRSAILTPPTPSVTGAGRQRPNIALRETLPGAKDHQAKVYKNTTELERKQDELIAADKEIADLLGTTGQLSASAPILTIQRLRQALEQLNQRRRSIHNQLAKLEEERGRLDAADPNVGEVRLDAQGNPTLYLNRTAMRVIQNLIRPGQEGFLKGADWSVGEARWVKNRMLEARAGDGYEQRVWSPLMRLLDAAIARSHQGGIALVGKMGQGVQSAINTMREELIHRWQRSRTANGLTETHLSDEAFLRLHYAMPSAAYDYLRNNGYQSDSPKNEVKLFVIETAAKIMANKWRTMGLNVNQAADWLDRYYNEVTQQHGTQAVAEVKHTFGIAREMQQEREGQYGSTTRAAATGAATATGPQADTDTGRALSGLEDRGQDEAPRDVGADAGREGRVEQPPQRMDVEREPLEPTEAPDSQRRPIKTFVSSNVFNLESVADAQKRLGSMPHKLLRQESAWLLNELGSKVKPRSGTGIWSDGAEDTLLHEFPADADPDLVTYHNAIMAKAGLQKFLLNFFPHEEGNDIMYRLTLPKSSGGASNISKVLAKHGIQASTIVNEYGGHGVFIATTGEDEGKIKRAVVNAVNELGGTDGAELRRTRGRSEYVGHDDRTAAGEVFARIIDDKENLHPEWRETRLRLESRPDFVELRRLGDESLRLLESGQIKDPFTRASHGSTKPDIKAVDPSYHGKGPQGGAETRRKKAWPDFWVNRSYFQIEGTPGEPIYERLPYQYKSIFNRENLYDFHGDPRGLYSQVPDDVARYGEGAITYFEKLIKDAGYDGYYVSYGSRAGTVAAFNNTPVEAKLKAGEIKLPAAGEKPQGSERPPQHFDLETLKREAATRKPVADLKRELQQFNLNADLGEDNTAALVAADGRVALGDYHKNIRGQVGYGKRGKYWEQQFLNDGGVRVRARSGEVNVEFGNADPDTFQRVRNVIDALPGDDFVVDYQPLATGTGTKFWMGDRESVLAKLDEWETRGVHSAPAYGSAAYWREQGDQAERAPQRFDLENLKAEASARNPITYKNLEPGVLPEEVIENSRNNFAWEDIEHRLLENERKGYEDNPDLQRKYTAAVNMMPDEDEFDAAVQAGMIGRMWYERSSRAFDALIDTMPDTFKKRDKEKFLNFVAALSPVQTVRLNLSMAITMWDRWNRAGRPQDVKWKDKKNFNGVVDKNALLYRIMKGGEDEYVQEKGASLFPDMEKEGKTKKTPGVDLESRLSNSIRALQGQPMSGPKVSAFAPNLGENADKSTNDTWMAVFADTDPNTVNQKHIYDALSTHVRIAAEKNGISTRQAQAAIWSFIKSLAELSGWGKNRWIPPQEVINNNWLTPDLVALHSQDFADLLQNDKIIRGKLAEIGGDLNALDRKLKRRVPQRPAIDERTSSQSSQRLLGAANRLEAARHDTKVRKHLARKMDRKYSLFEVDEHGGLYDDLPITNPVRPSTLEAIKAEAELRRPQRMELERKMSDPNLSPAERDRAIRELRRLRYVAVPQ